MTNQELQAYERMGIPAPKQKKKLQDFGVYEITEYIFCFLLSKIYLFGALSPFGLAYFVAVFPKQKKGMYVLAVCLGLLTANMGLSFMKYAGALVITASCSLLMEKEFSKHQWLYPITAGCSLALTGFVFILFNGFLLYDILYQVLESILVFLSFFAFNKAVMVVRGITKRRVFETAETLSLLVLCAGVVMSLACIPYFQGGAHLVSVLVILIVALTCGLPLTCTAGVLLGFVNSLSDVLPAQVVAVYAVSALCAGVLQSKGRFGVMVGFLVANAATMLYFNASANSIISVYYILGAGTILFLIPDAALSVFGELMKSPRYALDSVERIRDIMSRKLMEASLSFNSLSQVFHETVENRVNADIRDPGLLFDKTADRVCRNCSLMKYCWQKEYNDTRHALLTLYHRMEQRGEATVEEVPESFRSACIQLDVFLENLNKNYDLHKVNLLWAGRVLESRKLVTEQFNNIASVLKHLQTELSMEPTEGIRLERRILAALDRKGFSANYIRVTGTETLEVRLDMDYYDEENLQAREVEAIISSTLQTPMLRLSAESTEGSLCLRFIEKPRYTMEAGFAQVAGRGGAVCGDHHMFSVSHDGKYILALSDGMGQGSKAESQSNMTVHLIRKLLSAGFDKETALRLINSMLMVSAERESFATADLCLVNLYSGALEFIKIGASSSFVKNGERVDTVTCSSLPAGILCNVEADCDLKYAKAGDFVVMVTDGIADALEGNEEAGLHHIISQFNGTSPQQLADEILHTALGLQNGIAKDDMTVVAARLLTA